MSYLNQPGTSVVSGAMRGHSVAFQKVVVQGQRARFIFLKNGTVEEISLGPSALKVPEGNTLLPHWMVSHQCVSARADSLSTIFHKTEGRVKPIPFDPQGDEDKERLC